jgi:hypothetical protein
MEDLLSTGIDGQATNFETTFQRGIQILNESGCPYVLVGTVALDTHVRPRFTDEIDVLCHNDAQSQIEAALISSGFIPNQSCCGNSKFITEDAKVHINLFGNNSRARRYALSYPIYRQVFAVTTRIASPLSLLWIFLESDEIRDKADAIALIESGLVSPDEIRPLLNQNGATGALATFDRLHTDIALGKYSGSYNDSVKARILGQQKNQTRQA